MDGVFRPLYSKISIGNGGVKGGGAIRTRTIRKAFGYRFYQRMKGAAALQQISSYSSPSIILRYIGMNDEMVDRVLEGFNGSNPKLSKA
ncbi:hypothetical protein ACH0BF_23045 [Pseudobacillus sp. 179-B 2D1 NHS]|uniref:hypothetical protein n=1 Tax=Pseudobacillus sp. 179-B 2D1 NHS TaxID=3374292 RepID=UPI0038796AB1